MLHSVQNNVSKEKNASLEQLKTVETAAKLKHGGKNVKTREKLE